METTWSWFLTILIIVLCLAYYYLTRNFDFWTKRNIPGPKPLPYFGTYKDVLLNTNNYADYVKSLYDAYPKEKVIGLFDRAKPALMIKDLDIIKDVMIKHFDVFANRGVDLHFEIEPFSTNLFNLDFERWRPLRRRLTPSFTASKLKDMFPLIQECVDEFVKYLDIQVAKDEPIECHELIAKFATDIIGMCAFGLSFNAIKDENSEFRKIGRELFENSWANRIRHFTRTLPRWMALCLKPLTRQDHIFSFFYKTIIEAMEFRKQNYIRRNDYIDSLIDMRDEAKRLGEEGLPDSIIISQAYAFFLGALDSPTGNTCGAMYELAHHHDIQENLRKEVVNAMNQHGGKLTYEAVQSLQYEKKILLETFRKYSSGIMFSRQALRDYHMEKAGITIPKGMKVYIPIFPIHRDPTYYPDPDKFDPERFDEKVIASRPPMTNLTFGEGPRICIGKRFAMLEMRLLLATIVLHYKIDVCDKTFKVYKKRNDTLLLGHEGGYYLKLRKRDT